MIYVTNPTYSKAGFSNNIQILKKGNPVH